MCDQSGFWTLKLTVSQKWTDGISWFLCTVTNSCKLKGDQKFLEWTWSKMGVASCVRGLKYWFYLKNEQMEQSDFLHVDTN